jgi:hypothetical protein
MKLERNIKSIKKSRVTGDGIWVVGDQIAAETEDGEHMKG